MKNQGAKRRQAVRILMVVCIVGMLYSAAVLIAENRQYSAGDAVYRQVRQIGVVSAPAPPKPADNPAQTAAESGAAEEEQREPAAAVDFEALAAINADIAGWIASGNGEIDYPVVQGGDNDYYLNRLFNGKRNKLGSIFMDYRNHQDFSDRNTILYGHNMRDGAMFASLIRYQEQRYYDAFPTMTLYTPEGEFLIELFAGVTVDGSYEAVRLEFEDREDFEGYLQALREASTFDSPVAVTGDDRILALCTCDYVFENARYALFGKLTPVQ